VVQTRDHNMTQTSCLSCRGTFKQATLCHFLHSHNQLHYWDWSFLSQVLTAAHSTIPHGS